MEGSQAVVAVLSALLGGLVSLAFMFIPGVKTWFNKLGAEKSDEEATTMKRGVMALALLVITVVVFGLTCVNWFTQYLGSLTCDQQGIEILVVAFLSALGGNTATYWGTPSSKKRPAG